MTSGLFTRWLIKPFRVTLIAVIEPAVIVTVDPVTLIMLIAIPPALDTVDTLPLGGPLAVLPVRSVSPITVIMGVIPKPRLRPSSRQVPAWVGVVTVPVPPVIVERPALTVSSRIKLVLIPHLTLVPGLVRSEGAPSSMLEALGAFVAETLPRLHGAPSVTVLVAIIAST